MIRRNAILALMAAAALLSACGRRATLDKPAPLIGETYKPTAEQLTRDESAARARKEGAVHADRVAPQSVDEVRTQRLPANSDEPASQPSPISTFPP
jgi:hypothetical protein